jgi:hypothetical protein
VCVDLPGLLLLLLLLPLLRAGCTDLGFEPLLTASTANGGRSIGPSLVCCVCDDV